MIGFGIGLWLGGNNAVSGGASLLDGSESDGTQLLTSAGTDFSSWGQYGTTITANAAVAPDGTTTAFSVDEGTSGPTRHMFTAIDSPTGLVYPVRNSVYAKAANRRYLQAYIIGNGIRAYWVADLQAGSITDSGIDPPGTGTLTGVTCAAGANGFFKISAIFSGPDANMSWEYSLSNTPTFTKAAGSSPSYTGTSEKIYLWRHKLTNYP